MHKEVISGPDNFIVGGSQSTGENHRPATSNWQLSHTWPKNTPSDKCQWNSNLREMDGIVFEDIFKEQFVPLDRRKRVGNYQLEKFVLGTGSFSTVRLGHNQLTGEKAAIKIVPKKSILQKERAWKRFCREINVLRKLRHPRIVRFYEWMETDRNLYLVLELVEGENLRQYLTRMSRLSENEARRYMVQMVEAVDYMHSQGMLHRDLKPANVVLENTGNIKIIDFGTSVSVENIDQLTRQCGSPVFIAPEILDRKPFSAAADIWSLGVSLYLLVTGVVPFPAETTKNFITLHFNIIRGCDFPKYISNECKDLISRMLTVDPAKRITMEDIKSHPWLNRNYSL